MLYGQTYSHKTDSLEAGPRCDKDLVALVAEVRQFAVLLPLGIRHLSLLHGDPANFAGSEQIGLHLFILQMEL